VATFLWKPETGNRFYGIGEIKFFVNSWQLFMENGDWRTGNRKLKKGDQFPEIE